MVCIFCGNKTEVTNSRRTSKGLKVWRRRRCFVCQSEWTTIEEAELGSGYRVERSSGLLEPFQWVVLFTSIYEANKHRKSPAEDAEALCDTVVGQLQATRMPVWKTGLIKQLTTQALQQFDSTAASVYHAYRR